MAAVCFSLLSGRSASGGMHIDASGALLAMFTLPTLLCSAWAARRPGAARLAAWAGWTIAAVALWWVFWLPATLVDMAPGARYGADNRGIPLPATAFVQMAVACIAVWLMSLRQEDGPGSRGIWRRAAAWLAMTAAALALAEAAAAWATAQPALATAGLVVAASAFAIERRLARAGKPLARFALGLLAGQSLLVGLWAALHHWGDRLPQGLNPFV